MRLFGGGTWRSIGILTGALMIVASPAASQFTSFSHDPKNILEGSWQSCREADGRYAERIYEHVVGGAGKFEVHLGPGSEFAMFQGVQSEHRDHASAENLLQPYRVVAEGGRAKQRWDIAPLGLAFTVSLAGGSRTACESWFILLEPLRKPSH